MYEIFAKLLEKFDVKAADVSKATGLPSSLFSEWKRGKSKPKADKLQKIADYFGVTLNYLLIGSEKEESNVNQTNTHMYEIFEQLLQKYGITPYKISKDTGITQSTLSDWKRGISTPKQDKLQKIADYFGVSLAYIISGKEEPVKKETTLTLKDERDITKDLNNIMDKLLSGDTGPASYDGEELDPEAAELFRDELAIALRRLKIINKEKYTPKKYKK